jgi:hypothetical protein
MSRVKYLLDGSVRATGKTDTRTLEHAEMDNYDHRPPEGKLPSFGSERETCGDDYHNFCSSCGATERVGKTCNSATCPRCWAKWCVERATKITSKMEERRQEIAYRRSGHSPKFHHVVISFPGIRFDRDNSEEAMYELSKNIMSQLGVDGGALLYHPFRGESGDDRGVWKNRIGEGTEWTNVRDELEHSEHIHAIVLADTVDKMACKSVYNDTGINIHRVEKKDSNVSIYDLKDLASTTAYSLSHAFIGDDRAGLRYFGSVAQTKADDTTVARCNAEVRSVAQRVLGVAFSDLSCTSDSDTDHSHDHEQASSDGDADPSEEAENESDYCGGRLLDIHDAPRFLNDDKWVENADYADELREIWEYYKEGLDAPPPD